MHPTSVSRRDARLGTWRTGIRRAIQAGSRPGPWKRGPVLATLTLLLALVMLLHADIPDWRWNLGSLTETFLPWLGLLIPVLLAGALRRRSASALAALVLSAVVWLHLFGGVLTDKSRPGGFLTMASENVNAGNPDPASTARDLAASGADVLALEELTPQAAGTYEKELAKAYPYHTLQGTVGLWSKLPAHHGGHRPRAADRLCGPPGVRAGESRGGLLDGLAGHRRAGARPGHRRRSG
jgi:vancomycin resistance protein VanJ